MNKNILNTEIQKFINKNLNKNISDIILKGTCFQLVSTLEIAEQIEAKAKSQKKLPTWFDAKNIYYPNKLNIEQTSSERTADYKSRLLEGESLIDLTGGFGVDSLYFSKCFKTVVHCEINQELSDIVSYNYNQFQIDNIEAINTEGLDYLKNSKRTFDWIYLDPSRRHDVKGKVFFLSDCLPNVPKHLDFLFEHAQNIMIKTSPLLDLSVGINELKHVKAIHIVAVNNEVKELLWVLEAGFNGPISIKTINLKSDQNDYFNFTFEHERETKANFSIPLDYLYEPNAAILKSGGFNSITKILPVFKLHKHSHLYTSSNLTPFPGRTFKIETVIPFNKKDLKNLKITKANITTRNFPESVQQIRNKYKIKDGGDDYLFFTTDIHGNKVILMSVKAQCY